MDKPSFAERFRYWFDNWMSRGTIALMGLLGIATVVLVVGVTFLVWVFRAFPEDAPDGDFIDILWGGLMRTLDSGTMGGDVGWGFRVLMLVVTVGTVAMYWPSRITVTRSEICLSSSILCEM